MASENSFDSLMCGQRYIQLAIFEADSETEACYTLNQLLVFAILLFSIVVMARAITILKSLQMVPFAVCGSAHTLPSVFQYWSLGTWWIAP